MTSIFLSAVSKEFRSYRGELAHALTRKGFLVKVQEDFTASSGSLLEKLDAYIRKCDIVICLVGDRYGTAPEPLQSRAFSHIADGQHSYTQWEYILAKHHQKKIYVFYPGKTAKPDQELDEPKEIRLLQQSFKKNWIEAYGIDHTPFNSQAHLKEEVLVIPSLTPESENLTVADKVNPANPYIGLRRFEKKDREKFFGRDKLTAELRERIETSPLLSVFGNSDPVNPRCCGLR